MAYRCRHHVCDRVFDTKTGRATHEHMAHSEHYSERKTLFTCPYCGNQKYFDTELGLQAHLEERHGIPSKTLDRIERRTFENLVYIYNDELYKIESDRIIGGFLGGRERSRLLREGVLVIEEFGRMGRPTVYRLSEEALQIIEGNGRRLRVIDVHYSCAQTAPART